MNSFLGRILIVLGVASVLTFGLVSVEFLTRPQIEKNAETKLRKRILTANNIAYNDRNVNAVFTSNVEVIKKGGQTFYRTKDNAVSFIITGSGLWAPITTVVSMEPDLTTIKGMSIITESETPGLGSRVAEPSFLDEFHGKSVSPRIEIVKPGKAAGPNQVDGITGATMTSNAFQAILNSQIKKMAAIYQGASQ